MYKVLLVDDERIVRLALNSIINWEQEGFTVCGSVSSGKDALEQIELQQPHLVITDIVMPEMDGISLIQQARSRGYVGEFILLTNHQDFSYAVTALKNNVLDYILKTDLTPEAFSPTLKRVREKLDALPQTTLNTSCKTPDPDLKCIEHFLRTPSAPSEIFSHARFFLYIFLRGELLGSSAQFPTSALKNIIEDVLKKDHFFTFTLSPTRAIVLSASLTFARMLEELSPHLERLRERIHLYMNTDCGFVLSRSFSNTSELQNSLDRCKSTSFLAIYQGFGFLLHEEDIESYFSVPIVPTEIYSGIQNAIDASDYSRATEEFEAFWKKCSERHLLPQDASIASTALQNLLLINNSLWVEHAIQDSSISPLHTFFPAPCRNTCNVFPKCCR